MKIGIIGALDFEIDNLKSQMINLQITETASMKFYEGKISNTEIVAAIAGVGKVNAAACAQTMILKYQPSIIINIGVAGGLDRDLQIGDIAVAQSVAEHDMDTSPCGDPPGFISGINLVQIPCDEKIVEILYDAAQNLPEIKAKKGVIASGDQFIHTEEQRKYITDHFHAIAAEMEGAAIGHVCYMNRIPFGVLRALSDAADQESPVSFLEFAKKAAHHSIILITAFIKIMEEVQP